MPIISKKVFITPSIFVAFVNRSDDHYHQSTAFFRYFAQEKYSLYTSNVAVVETANRLQKEVSTSIAKEFLKTIFISNVEIIWSTESDEKAALKLYVGNQNFESTFSQALTAVMANRRFISQICTFESHQPMFGQTVFDLPS